MKRLLAALALACSLGALSCFSERDATEPLDVSGECAIPLSAIGGNKVVVMVRNFQFFPDTVRIRPGGEVTWVNCETDVADFHTSTSEDELWDSGALNRRDFYTRRFDAGGAFDYFCVPHPFMQGTVIVQ